MLQVGDGAPGFELPGTDGSDIETYRLSDYARDGAVVLAFYPFDFSPVCTREPCEFRDPEWFTVEPGVDVFGISTDSAYAHRAFVERHDLTFRLPSDANGTVRPVRALGGPRGRRQARDVRPGRFTHRPVRVGSRRRHRRPGRRGGSRRARRRRLAARLR